MKAVIQRIKYSKVIVDNKIVGETNKGLNVLIGFEKDDTEEKLQKMAKKILNLRLFEEKFSKNIIEIKGEILLVPNFTIPAITKKGTRPNFQNSMQQDKAKNLFEKLKNILEKNITTKSGIFGADMEVVIINDGPVTLILEV